MLFASLIPLALIAISSGASSVSAATISQTCSGGRHCIYGPPKANRIGDVTVSPGQGSIEQSGMNGVGAGIWLLSNGAAGHLDVQCKGSGSVEEFYWYLDQKGSINKLQGSSTNSGIAKVHFGGGGPTLGGNEVQATGPGADIYVDCP